MSSSWSFLAMTILTALTPLKFSTAQFPCSMYTTISEPWRNVGFCSATSNQTDRKLAEGWYRFDGTAGDVVVSSCVQATNNQNLTNYNLFTCNSTATEFIRCGQGFTIYYLRPTQATYATRHSSCSNSSCGQNAQCGDVYGSCVCDPGLIILKDKQAYTCSDLPQPDCQLISCSQNFLNELDKLLNRTELLSQEVVETYLTSVMNLTATIKYPTDKTQLISYGNHVLAVSEKLVSLMVKPTCTENTTSIKLSSMEAQIFMVGKMTLLTEIPPLSLSRASLKINLVGISKENNGSAAVVFISYSNMTNILKPSFFNINSSDNITMMSVVVSASLPDIRSTSLTEPVEFTFQHIEVSDGSANLSCVYWKESIWVDDGCSVSKRNSTYTMCSCTHLSTFALIMMTKLGKTVSPKDGETLNTVAVSVGLMFLLLTILTLAVCQRGPKMTNVALLNLSISLFLAHLVFLLTQQHLKNLKILKLCQMLAGVTHFLFLSAFVWMFIEAVLLYICVKNLSRISSKQREVLNWKCMIVIGYIVPLVVVAVTAGLYPDVYTDEECWLRGDYVWSFLGPVSCIIAVNLLLSCVIFENLRRALSRLDKSVSHLKHTRTLVFKTLLQFVILGCTWVLGFFIHTSNLIYYIFLFLNSQQGTFIFIVHCIFNQEIREQYRKYWVTLRQCSKYKSMPENQSRASCSLSN